MGPSPCTTTGRSTAARRCPDGPISVHKNGTFDGRPPRVARYRIHSQRRTANLVEQVTDPRVPSSFCCGGAPRLPHGHWLVGWGGKSIVAELGPGGGRPLTIRLPDQLFSYRSVPVPASL